MWNNNHDTHNNNNESGLLRLAIDLLRGYFVLLSRRCKNRAVDKCLPFNVKIKRQWWWCFWGGTPGESHKSFFPVEITGNQEHLNIPDEESSSDGDESSSLGYEEKTRQDKWKFLRQKEIERFNAPQNEREREGDWSGWGGEEEEGLRKNRWTAKRHEK